MTLDRTHVLAYRDAMTASGEGRASAADGVRYEEVECKSVLNRVQGMDFRWSINPYKGCVHGCHYCFARRYHGFIDLNPDDDFSSLILVRTNAPEVLRRELSRRSWKRETVALGTATDPYQPIEGRYRLTRGILEALRDFRTPVGIVTKGTMIVRDIDVLADLARRAGASVCMSITTLDRDTWRRLEPGTAPPHQRLRAVQRLSEAGVEAGVLVAPIVPGMTDASADLRDLVKAAADHGARFVGARILALQGTVKDHFLGFMREEYPELLAEYRRLFPGANAPKDYTATTMAYVDGLRRLYRVGQRSRRQVMQPEPSARQLSLAL